MNWPFYHGLPRIPILVQECPETISVTFLRKSQIQLPWIYRCHSFDIYPLESEIVSHLIRPKWPQIQLLGIQRKMLL
jgi:hypothetical protein